jgi:hypothetical protein
MRETRALCSVWIFRNAKLLFRAKNDFEAFIDFKGRLDRRCPIAIALGSKLAKNKSLAITTGLILIVIIVCHCVGDLIEEKRRRNCEFLSYLSARERSPFYRFMDYEMAEIDEESQDLGEI